MAAKIIITSIVAAMVSACTYTANVAPTSTPVSEILPQRRVPALASIYVEPELATLHRDASTGFTCSAHSFPVAAGPAIELTIRTVNENSFLRLLPGGNRNAGAPGAARHVVFGLESFNPRLEFSERFFGAKAIANTELVMRVGVMNATGTEILRTMVSGNGNAERETFGCDGGADALSEATTLAIRRALENYVYRVINADQIGLTDSEKGGGR